MSYSAVRLEKNPCSRWAYCVLFERLTQ